MNIGAKIRLLRKEKRVTQEELAEYLHISSQAVSKWETGSSCPDIDFLPKLVQNHLVADNRPQKRLVLRNLDRHRPTPHAVIDVGVPQRLPARKRGR